MQRTGNSDLMKATRRYGEMARAEGPVNDGVPGGGPIAGADCAGANGN